MNREFIPYELALELKQLGFDEPCLAFYQVEYHENSPIMVDDNDQYRITGFRTCKNSEIPSHYISCPTYSQAFRWFRYNYWYYVSISPSIDIGNVDFTVEVSQFFQEDRYVGEGDDEEYFPRGLELVHTERFDTYEEAELACLKKLIEIAKTK
jgi:hypothetical protein